MARVLFGTCGWSDDSIKSCGRFYPSWVKTADQRLQHYGQVFPCVEVDSSTYAIPRPENTRKWAASTPTGFKFHFKAFGLFTHQSAAANSLPARVRHLLPATQPPQQSVSLQQLGPEGEQLVWAAFHEALQPVMQAGKLGCVVFQFQLSFACTAQSWEYLERCRDKLDKAVQMAVEFRNRTWFTDPVNAERLCAWLSSRGISLISADELQHETFQKDRQQQGLQPGQQRIIMPIALHVTQPFFHYVRVHRRHGTTDRTLPDGEIQAWAQRITQQLAPSLRGPLYFLWGTDWEDAPLVNARALTAALPPELRMDWKTHVRGLVTQARGSIASMLLKSKVPASSQADAQQAGPEAVTEDNSIIMERAASAAADVLLTVAPVPAAPGPAANSGARQEGQDSEAQKAVSGISDAIAGTSTTQQRCSVGAESMAVVAVQVQAGSTGSQGSKRPQKLQTQPAKKTARKSEAKTLTGQKLLTSYFGK